MIVFNLYVQYSDPDDSKCYEHLGTCLDREACERFARSHYESCNGAPYLSYRGRREVDFELEEAISLSELWRCSATYAMVAEEVRT